MPIRALAAVGLMLAFVAGAVALPASVASAATHDTPRVTHGTTVKGVHDAPGFPGTSTTAPFNECPAIGYDESCGILISVSNNGEKVLQDPNNTYPGQTDVNPGQQNPYDANDDTLVGIVNTSSKPIYRIQLSGSSSGTDLFGFEGDGICTYANGGASTATGPGTGGTSVGGAGEPPGGYTGDTYCNASQLAGGSGPSGPDPNGSDYQGPRNTFDNISSDTTTGDVVFNGGLQPGQSTYFSLEESLLANQVSVEYGYWMVAADGGIFAYDAPFFGSMGGIPLNSPVVGMVATPDGMGYWEVAADGGLFAFGDAHFYGSMGGQPLNQPVVGIASSADGKGYWEVAADGGLFSFGDAKFQGSMGGQPLNQPVVGIAGSQATGGYWEVAADGGLFAFNAPFFGSPASAPLNQPVVGMASTPDGQGYWEAATDGGIFNYGDSFFWGSLGATTLNAPVVGIAGSQ